MNIPCLIDTFSHESPVAAAFQRKSANLRSLVRWAFCGLVLTTTLASAAAQDAENATSEEAAAKSQSKASELGTEPIYPLAVAVDGAEIFTVDLDLPGVWRTEGSTELYAAGTKLLRKPMNRPRCVIVHPEGGILVGDTATREIYWIASAEAEPKPLTDGYLGVVMALALSPDGKTLYAGDAEKRATFKLPVEGGKPELVARVNARGLAFDSDGKLWAVTPDAAAVKRIDVESNEVEDIVTGRPFQYPNGLCWAGDHGFVTDGYGKCIWKFTADGKTEKWHEGDPLVGPVGITLNDDSLFVADPKQKQVYQFDLKTKEAKPRL
ncbi:MAG: hypothetical protein ACR2NZ_22215 [Rubripirellula sp.]